MNSENLAVTPDFPANATPAAGVIPGLTTICTASGCVTAALPTPTPLANSNVDPTLINPKLVDINASSITLDNTVPQKTPVVVPIADAVTATIIDVNLIGKDGKPMPHLQPQLSIIGTGVNSYDCPLTDSNGVSKCSIYSNQAGDKLINLASPFLNNPLTVVFYEPSNRVSVAILINNSPANLSTKNIIGLTMKDFKGNPLVGVTPVGSISGAGTNIMMCLSSGTDGVSQCEISSNAVGDKIITFSNPLILPIQVTFTPSIFKFTSSTSTNRAYISADGSSSVLFTITLTDATGTPPNPSMTPTLNYQPSSDTTTKASCGATNANGVARCVVSSNLPGTKIIGVSSPTGISETIEVIFAPLDSNISALNPGSTSLANGTFNQTIEIYLANAAGDPIVGIIPKAYSTDSNTFVICQSSDATGTATCKVSSLTPGIKQIYVDEPPIKDPISLIFNASPIIALNLQTPADGKSPAILLLDTKGQVGVIPVLDIKGPATAVFSYTCTPSIAGTIAGTAESKCFVVTNVPGDYSVTEIQPSSSSLTLTFTDAHSTFNLSSTGSGTAIIINNTAKADGIDSVVLNINVKNSAGAPLAGVTPKLSIAGSGVNNYTCSITGVDGLSVCQITSTAEGIKAVSVVSPLIAGEINIQFFSTNTILDTASSQLTAIADKGSMSIIHIILKDSAGKPIVGIIPVLEVPSGVTYKCYPSDAKGDARCEIQSLVAGTINIKVIDPVVATPIQVTFQANTKSCPLPLPPHSTIAEQNWKGPGITAADWSICTIKQCNLNYSISANSCVANTQVCAPMPLGADVTTSTQTWELKTAGTWGDCNVTKCNTNYNLNGSGLGATCLPVKVACDKTELPSSATTGIKTWADTQWGACQATACAYPTKLASGACVPALVTPLNLSTGILIGDSDLGEIKNATLSQTYTSNPISITGIEIPIPITISGGIHARIETQRGPVSSWTQVPLGTSYADLEPNDLFRIVADSAAIAGTLSTVSIDIGSIKGLSFKITTLPRTSPPNVHLVHVQNENKFKISWDAGGFGNGGVNGCALQYLKDSNDPNSWTLFNNSTFNCDLALASTVVQFPPVVQPEVAWTNSFASGISMRVVDSVSKKIELFKFKEQLTCTPTTLQSPPKPLPAVDDPNIDENCDGLWTNDADKTPPVGGSFAIDTTTGIYTSAATHELFTKNPQINLNVTCPTDQSGKVLMAIGESATAAGAFTDCKNTAQYNFANPNADGVKTIYMFFQDAYGNTIATPLSNKITLDKTAPSGGSVLLTDAQFINGVPRLKDSSVKLSVTCPATEATGVVKMAYGLAANPSNWVDCAAQVGDLSLPVNSLDGNYTVYMSFKDALDNQIALTQLPFIYDSTAPVATISITAGTFASSTTSIVISATDAQNSFDKMKPLSCNVERTEDSVTSASTWKLIETNDCTKTSVVDSTIVTDKTYFYRITVKDALGNVSTPKLATGSVTVDLTPPTGTTSFAISNLNGYTNSASLSLNSIVCPTDISGPVQMAYGTSPNPTNWTTCGPTATLTLTGSDAIDGSKTIYMIFRDSLLNQTKTAISQTIKLDQAAPQGGSFTIANGARTNVLGINLNIVCPTNDGSGNLNVAFDTNAKPRNWIACVSGVQTITLPASSTDMSYDIYVSFQNALGTISDLTKQTIIYDKTAPVVTLTATAGGLSNGWTKSTSASIAISANDGTTNNPQGSAPLTCKFERSQALITDTNPPVWTTLVQPTTACSNFTDSTLQNGYAYSYRVTATDSVGNSNPAPIVSSGVIKVQTSAPVGGVVTIDTSTGIYTQPATNYLMTKNATISVNVKCPTDPSGAVTYSISESSTVPNAFLACQSASFAAPYTLINTSSDGAKLIYIYFQNALGVTTTPISQTIYYDHTPPTGGNFAINAGQSINNSVRLNTTSVGLNVSSCPSDVTSNAAYISYATSSSSDSTVASNWSALANCTVGNINNIPMVSTADGQYYLFVKIQDALGNNSITSLPFIIDTAAPFINSFTLGTTGWTNQTSVNLTPQFTDAQNSSPFKCTVDRSSDGGSSWIAVAALNDVPCTSGSPLTDSTLQNGASYKYRLKVRDGLGTITTAAAAVVASGSINIDNSAPTFSVANASSPSCNQINFSINSASDNGGSGLASLAYSFDGQPFQSSSTYTVTGTSKTISSFRVQDAAGNISTNNTSITGTANSCTCTVNGATLYDGNTQTVSTNSSATEPTYCSSISKTVVCRNGSLFDYSTNAATSISGYYYNSCTQNYLPAVPYGLTFSNTTSDGFRLYWYSSSTANSYTVVRATDSSFSSPVTNYVVNSNSVQMYLDFAGLSSGTTYYFKIYGTNNSGNSSYSSVFNSTTLLAQVTGVSASSISATGFTVNWNSTSGATGYKIYYSDSTWATKTINVGNSLSYTFSGLNSNALYHYGVSAYSNFDPGTGGPTPHDVNTLSAAVNGQCNTNIAASTTPPSLSTLCASGTPYTTTGVLVYSDSSNVSANTDTFFWSCNGSSGGTNAGVCTSYKLPTTPTTYANSSVSASGFILSWAGDSGASSYNVNLYDNNYGYVGVYSSSYNSYTVSGLNAGTTYHYWIQSINSRGGSSFVSWQTASTAAAPAVTCINPIQGGTYGQAYTVGMSGLAYQSSQVPYGSSCVSETRVCQSNGTFSGSYNYGSCTVASAPLSFTSTLGASTWANRDDGFYQIPGSNHQYKAGLSVSGGNGNYTFHLSGGGGKIVFSNGTQSISSSLTTVSVYYITDSTMAGTSYTYWVTDSAGMSTEVKNSIYVVNPIWMTISSSANTCFTQTSALFNTDASTPVPTMGSSCTQQGFTRYDVSQCTAAGRGVCPNGSNYYCTSLKWIECY